MDNVRTTWSTPPSKSRSSAASAGSDQPSVAGSMAGRRLHRPRWQAVRSSSPGRRPASGWRLPRHSLASGRASSWSDAIEVRLRALSEDLAAVHAGARFPIVVADMGSLASVRGGGRAHPRDRDSTRRPDRQRRCDVPRPSQRPRRDRGDVRAARRRPVRAGRRPAAAPPADRWVARRGRDLGRDVCTSGWTSTTSSRVPRPTREPAPMPGRSGRRSRSCASGRAVSPRAGSPLPRCTPDGRTRPDSRSRSRSSTAVMRPLLRSPGDAVDTIVWLATHPDQRSTTRAAVP